MSIFKLLKFDDIEIANLQSVDEMTVVPLLGATRGEIAKPQKIIFEGTRDYGQMVFLNNDEDCDGIVPANLMVRGPGAQDHAMSGSGIVKANSQYNFKNSCCIEEHTSGYLTSINNAFDILPIELRKCFLDRVFREEEEFTKLWPKVTNWLTGLSVDQGEAHLEYFYNAPHIKKELEIFAAEFEPVEDQIGAIILFSGIPVGIEIMPSQEHWDYYWKMLIRGCYGAELIRLKQLKRIDLVKQQMPKITEFIDVDAMREEMEDFIIRFQNYIPSLLKNISIKNRFMLNNSKTINSECIVVNDGGGEIISQNNKPVYLSLVL